MDVDANVNMDCISSQELEKLQKFYSNVYKCNLEEPGWSSLIMLERAIHQKARNLRTRTSQIFRTWFVPVRGPLIPDKALKTKFQFPTNDLNEDVELLVELYPPKPFKPKNKKIDKQKSKLNNPNSKNGTSNGQNGMDSGTGQTLDDSTDQGFELFENTIFAFHLIRRFLESFCEC